MSLRPHVLLACSALVCSGLACSALAASGQTAILAVVNQKDHTVVLTDPAARRVIATITVGVNGHEIAASPDGRLLYVPIYSSAGVGKPGTNGQTIAVIDVASRKLVHTIDLGSPTRPHRAVWGSDGNLYVTAELHNAIDIIDPRTPTGASNIIGQIPTGEPQSHMLAISPDGRRGYTANVGSGTVSVLDIPNRKLLKVIPLTKTVQRIVFSNDGRWVFTSDETQPRIAVLDTQTQSLSRWIPVTGIPYTTQPTADGRWLLVSTRAPGATPLTTGAGLLNVVDLHSMTVVRTIPLPSFATALFRHGATIYMTCPGNGQVEVLDPHGPPTTWSPQTLLTLTPGVDGMAWVNTPR